MNIGGLLQLVGAADAESHESCASDHDDEWRSLRPSIPPVFLLAMSAWACCAAGIEVLYGADMRACQALLAAGCVALAAGAVLVAKGNGFAGCLLVGLALGCILAASQAAVLLGQMRALTGTHEQMVEVVRDSRQSEYGVSAMARTQSGALVRLQLDEGEVLLVGDAAVVQGSFAAPSQKTARDSWRQGVVAVVRVSSLERLEEEGFLPLLRAARRAALDSLNQAGGRFEGFLMALQAREGPNGGTEAGSGDTGGRGGSEGNAVLFLHAVLLGHTDGLYASSLYQEARVDGLAHLLAVSGAHLVIVCSIVMLAMRRLALPRWLAVVLQAGFIACYLVLTGAPVSACRAAIMSLLALASFYAKRRPYALGALSAGVVGMLALDPSVAFSVSFVLSVGATVGIVLFNRFFEQWVRGVLGAGRSAAIDALALTAAASLVSVPVSACLFGQVSLVAPLANLIAAPVFSAVCVMGFAALALQAVFPMVGSAALMAVVGLVAAFCWVLHLLSLLPGAALPAYLPLEAALALAVGLPVLGWVFWPRPRTRGLLAALGVAMVVAACCLLGPMLQGDRIVMLDVGQGDAFVLCSNGHAMLVDTGTNDVMLLQGLAASGIMRLDAVLVTHPDDDHCGSLPALKGIVGVDRVLVAHDLLIDANSHCANLRAVACNLVGPGNLVGLSVGDRIVCGNIELSVLGPDAFADGGGNADSLVMLMRSDDDADGKVDHTALFCGDAESEQLDRYAQAGRLEPVEIYKVGHHGSKAAITPQQAQLLNPAVSLVSVGAYNRYGHPAAGTIQTLEDAGSAVFRTDSQGMVTCLLEPDRLEVRTQR